MLWNCNDCPRRSPGSSVFSFQQGKLVLSSQCSHLNAAKCILYINSPVYNTKSGVDSSQSVHVRSTARVSFKSWNQESTNCIHPARTCTLPMPYRSQSRGSDLWPRYHTRAQDEIQVVTVSSRDKGTHDLSYGLILECLRKLNNSCLLPSRGGRFPAHITEHPVDTMSI